MECLACCATWLVRWCPELCSAQDLGRGVHCREPSLQHQRHQNLHLQVAWPQQQFVFLSQQPAEGSQLLRELEGHPASLGLGDIPTWSLGVPYPPL